MTFRKSPALNLAFAILILFGAITGCGPAIEQPPLPDPVPLNLDGFEAAVVKQIDAAQAEWEAAPVSAQTNGNLAMLLHTYQQHTTASAYYQRARVLNPEEFRWAYLHALVLAKLGETDQVKAALRDAIQLDRTNVNASLRLAEQLADVGQDDESRKLYSAILRDHPNLPQALYGLGKQLLRQGDNTGVELLQAAVSRKGPYGAAHYALAEAYRNRGETQKANKQLALFEKFGTTTPPLPDTLMSDVQDLNESTQGLVNRSQRMITRGRAGTAIENLKSALARDPSAAGPHNLLIVAYGMEGKFEQAESHYRQGLVLNPEHARLHNNFGTLRLKQGRHKEAAEAFRAAIAADTDYLDAYVNLGAALETLGIRSEAIKQYKTALDRDPLHRLAGFHLGNAYMKMNSPYRAIQQYLGILEPEDGKTPEYLRALAVAYAQMRKNADAEATLQRAIAVASNTGREDMLPKLQAGLRLIQSANNPSKNETSQ